MKYDVFISYSRKDTKVADRVCEAFDKIGITYFIDRKGISGGHEFPVVIADAIMESQLVLFLGSKNSYESKYTISELTFAFNEKPKNTILPYIIDGSTMPPALRFVFSSINWRTIKSHPIETTLVFDILNLLGRKSNEVHKNEEQEKPKESKSDWLKRWKSLLAVMFILNLLGRKSQDGHKRGIVARIALIIVCAIVCLLVGYGIPWMIDKMAEQEREAEQERIAKMVYKGKGRDGVYQVGDYYDDGKKQGVVFEVTDGGKHGKIVSLKESSELLLWSSDSGDEQCRFIGANNEDDGAYNMAKVMQINNWQDKYPAFAWCAALGKGWYLPAKEELLAIYVNKDIINKSLSLKDSDSLSERCWTSTQSSSGVFLLVKRSKDIPTPRYNEGCHVRAVSTF